MQVWPSWPLWCQLCDALYASGAQTHSMPFSALYECIRLSAFAVHWDTCAPESVAWEAIVGNTCGRIRVRKSDGNRHRESSARELYTQMLRSSAAPLLAFRTASYASQPSRVEVPTLFGHVPHHCSVWYLGANLCTVRPEAPRRVWRQLNARGTGISLQQRMYES